MPVYPNGTSDEYIITIYANELLLLGLPPVDCGTPPVGCFLEITGYTSTDVTIRGDADGSIYVATSGASGNTTWYLNGVFVASGVTDYFYNFTGLTAGIYDVIVTDSHTPNACVVVQEDIVVFDGEFRTGNFSINSPTGLTAVGNPIIINVATAVNNPNPDSCVTTLTVAGTIANNTSIQFNLTSPFEYSQTFYAKNYPNKPNYFLASTLYDSQGNTYGSNTATEIATSLAEALQLDAVIPKVYYVNNSGAVVTLQAKESGSKFNIDATNVISSTTGITVTQVYAGEDFCDGQITDNYSISCEVMVNTDSTNQYPELGQTNDYNRVAELILPFSQNNIHRFDISSILASQVATPMPQITLTGSSLLPTVMQPWYCRLSELYPLVPNTNTVKKRYKTTTPVRWTINSSIDRLAPNDMQEYLGTFLSNLDALSLVLTFSGAIGNQTVTVSDYLRDTGSTITTDIKFKLVDTYGSQTFDWQSSPVFTGVTSTYPSGDFYISGTTSGVTETYHYFWFTNQYASDYGLINVYDYNSIKTDVKFLTNSPNPKQIQRNSNEFLYFILPKNYGRALDVRGDLYFYDGTSSLNQTFFTISTGTTNAGGCMIMNLSYDKLGLQNYEVSGSTNRKIKRAEIAVWQDDGVNPAYQYTETKVYRFEIDEMPRKFGVLFQNELGMYDAFDFIGVVEETIDRETDTYTVPLNYNIDGSLPKGFKNTATYNTKITKKVICNTGWIDEAHFDWLMELMKSNSVYSTSTDFQNYLNLTSYTYKKSSLDDLFDIECTFTWTIFENSIGI